MRASSGNRMQFWPKRTLDFTLNVSNNWKARWNYFNLFSFSYNLPLVTVSEAKKFLCDKIVTPVVGVQWSKASIVYLLQWDISCESFTFTVMNKCRACSNPAPYLHQTFFSRLRNIDNKNFYVKVILLEKILEAWFSI